MSGWARVVIVIATIVSAHVFQVQSSQPAEASMLGCTGSNDTSVNCISIHGTHLSVSNVRASRDNKGTVCNLSARMTATLDGSFVEPERWADGSQGCQYGVAWVDFEVNREYPDGTEICVVIFEDGQDTPGQPCGRIINPPPPSPGPAPCTEILDGPKSPNGAASGEAQDSVIDCPL